MIQKTDYQNDIGKTAQGFHPAAFSIFIAHQYGISVERKNVGKLENLNQTILRFILDDFESAYNILLDELSQLCFSVCTTDVFTILC